jgi:RNA polymerase sigma-B factor
VTPSDTAPGDRAAADPEVPAVHEPDLQIGDTLDLTDDARPGLTPPQQTLFEDNIGLAKSLARRFANRGEALEDLEQVAMLALVKAARRFDDERGVPFYGYATATISGELKRHFRDTRWAMRVPRLQQERYLKVRAATEAMTSQLGRPPTMAEIGERTGLALEEVVEVQELGTAFHLRSLDADDDDTRKLDPGTTDPNFGAVEARIAVTPALAELPAREREILRMRFVEQRSQSDIAAILGISQMHVSRLLRRSLDQMRRKLAEV